MPTEHQLAAYADLLLQVGLGPLQDRRVLIRPHVEAVALVRLLVARAYELGAARVDVQWTDPHIDVLTATLGPADAATVEPDDTAQLNTAASRGDAFLRIGGGENPTLEGTAGRRFAAIDAAWRAGASGLFEAARRGGLPWAIACYPTAAWAAQVFPGADDPVEELWAAIARVSRLDDDDPVAAWRAHAADLAARASHVSELDLVELRYEGPGTQLTVGVEGRRWVGGAGTTTGGTDGGGFGNLPNIPTEEVFTSPRWQQVEGTLALTKPYVFAGESIRGAQLVFEGGVVTSATCSSGRAALDQLLDTDEGSRRLGEVALVPHSSRVAQERLQWFHPLYDENEDCHVALGMSYVFTAPGTSELDQDAQLAEGLNHSRLHEDVVVGSDQLDVTGIDRDGQHHPLLVGGEWGFEPT